MADSDTDDEDLGQFKVLVYKRDGKAWDCIEDRGDADDIGEAQDEARLAVDEIKDGIVIQGEGDYRVTVVTPDGVETHEYCKSDENQKLFDECRKVFSCEEDGDTVHVLFHADNTTYHKVSIPLSTPPDPDGFVPTMLPEVDSITLAEAVREVVRLKKVGFLEATLVVEEKHPTDTVRAIVVDASEGLEEDELAELVREIAEKYIP